MKWLGIATVILCLCGTRSLADEEFRTQGVSPHVTKPLVGPTPGDLVRQRARARAEQRVLRLERRRITGVSPHRPTVAPGTLAVEQNYRPRTTDWFLSREQR